MVAPFKGRYLIVVGALACPKYLPLKARSPALNLRPFDISHGIPFLGYNEMLNFTRAAFDVAPSSKLLYSSDGVGMPEIHWLSARDGRSILGEVLGERVASRELDTAEAETIGMAVLRDNALRVYGIAGK